jgi:iron-sulfur cluster assembly accessory protein
MASNLHLVPHTLSSEEGAVIQLTESAASALRSAITGARTPVEGLRIAVQGGGCSGLQYMMGLVSEVEPGDLMVEDRGLKVYDPASAPLLRGTTIDFVVSMQGSGFTFDNPQAKSSCSCGKSFA